MLPGMFGATVKTSTSKPITFIGNAGENIGEDITITYNASSASGDYLLLMCCCDNANNVSTPSGWERLAVRSDSPEGKIYVFGKFKASDTSVFVSSLGTMDCSVLTFRGVDPVTPVQSNGPSIAVNPSSSVWSFPNSVATTRDNTYCVWGFAATWQESGSIASGWSAANVTNSQELIDIATTSGWDPCGAAWGGTVVTSGTIPGTVTANVAKNKVTSAFRIYLNPV